MSSRQPTRSPEGIRVRHSRSCRSVEGGRCSCSPSYEGWVYLKREDRKLRKSFPTLAAAKAWRADAVAAANRGKLRGPVQTTVRDAAAEFLRGARDGSIPNRAGHRYKPAALRGYERGLRRIDDAIGHMKLTEVTRADVQDFADSLTAEGLEASTVQNILDPLRVIFRRAIRRDVVAVDPTENLELRRPKGQRDRIATPSEAAALLAALPDSERAIWATAFYTGLRRGELRALRWADIDLPGRVVHVSRGWDDVEGEQDVKSDAGERDVPILDALAPELAAHRLRTGRSGEALVFGLDAQTSFYPSTVRNRALRAWGWKTVPNPSPGPGQPKQVLVKASEDALVPIGLHEARHTCASLLIASGANPKVIQKVMGHATIQMTFDQYGHLMPGGLEEAAAAANAYLAAAVLG